MAGGDAGLPWPKNVDAQEYLGKHKIIDLFDNLTSQLIYRRPDDPRAFMIEQIEDLIKSKTTQMDYPCLFDDTNIESVFGMLDPTGRGYITLLQYKEALTTLGVQEFDPRPLGSDTGRISSATFNREAKLGLAKTSATFHKADGKKR